MGIFNVAQPHRNVTDINFDLVRNMDWEQWVLLSSDRHHDNPKTRWDLEKEHLDEAVEYDAPVLDFGDLFCAMQGKYDKRSNKSHVRPEHQNDRYLDSLIDTAADFYEPYAHHFIMMAQGNHESAILKHHETNLNERLIAVLNSRTKSDIKFGCMQGFVRFRFREVDATGKKVRKRPRDTNPSAELSPRQTITLAYHHGWGGGGIMSFDSLNVRRRAGVVPDADIVVSGHTHDAWHIPIARLQLTQAGAPFKSIQHHIKCPSYKDAFGDGGSGWEVEKGMAPKPIGAVWLRFYWNSKETRVETEVRVDARGG